MLPELVGAVDFPAPTRLTRYSLRELLEQSVEIAMN